jgi:hypothetical protein
MAISTSDIQKIVNTEDDFGHEMRVGATIKAIPSFSVEHGGTYIDRVTGKPRQFDYRCSLTKETNAFTLQIPANGSTGTEAFAPFHAATRLVLAVECKNLNASFPLVVCGTVRQKGETFQDLVVSIGRSAMLPRGGAGTPGPGSLVYRAACKQSFYAQGGFVGKNLLRLKPDNSRSAVAVAGPDSDIYDKWAQAISSAVEMADAAQNCARDQQLVWSAVIPVVVLSDDSLWKVAYDGDGKASNVEQVDHCEYYVGHRITSIPGTFMFSHIHFFTLSAFGSFLSKMAVNENAWDILFNPGLLRFGPD